MIPGSFPSAARALHLVALLNLATTFTASAQPKPIPPGPMLDSGTITLESDALRLTLLRSSGTVAALSPKLQPTTDYTPGDMLKERSADTFYHLGDLDLRLRTGDTSTPGASPWRDASTAFRRQPVRVLASTPARIEEDLAPTLPADLPLAITRTWSVDQGILSLRFTLRNTASTTVTLGALGIPMVFNNIMHGRTLEQSYAKCSFYDPSISEDAGYVQVVRLTGTGPALLILPEGHTPLEAWKPILDARSKPDGKGLLGNDPTPRNMTFEGSFDWMVHSSAYAQNEWKGAQQWNPSTEKVLEPGEQVTYGLRFVVAPTLRGIEDTLSANHRPVAIGIPGYILPQDIDGKLFLRYEKPVRSIVSEPADALSIHDDGPTKGGDHAYSIHGVQWGRARLVITYSDGTVQSIAYRTIKPEATVVSDMGRFLYSRQWFDSPGDPFHRSPSVISYDDAAHAQVTQDQRVWIAGLSDEAGAGSWIAAAMKEYVDPTQDEVSKLESFIDGVLWGHLQVNEGEHKYGVHKSLFYYDSKTLPVGYYDPSLNWKTWASWDEKGADDLGRSFNYPHVVAAYWSLYRISRNTNGLAKKHPWQWYLDQAYQTIMAMRTQAPYYTQFGHMEGTVFIHVLEDLRHEGMTAQADQLEAWMRERADHWKTEAYPFGSEMPWDSTGQEEVYDWTRYFHYDDKADITRDAVLAYTPVLPSWGYNGSARRFWDFLYGGKYPRIERQLHHYGSGLNAIPLLAEYRLHPEDLYLLRAGYGGAMGPLANIDEKGFASAAFHSFPDKMALDPYSGDYGPNFFGFAMNAATYLMHDPRLGWLCFGGNISEQAGLIHIIPKDALRQRIFIAPAGAWLTLDAGRFAQVVYDPRYGSIRMTLAPATASTRQARLRIESGRYAPTTVTEKDAGAYLIPLAASGATVTLTKRD